MRRQTVEYEYQLKAAIKQQRLQEEMLAADQLAQKNRDFVGNLFGSAEKERRETQRQNIITAFNMISASTANAFMNPKFLARMTYLLLIGFGAFHFTRIAMGVITGIVMARLGKP
jgi:hypothetical protein